MTTDEYLSEMGYSLYDEFEKVLEAADIPSGSLVTGPVWQTAKNSPAFHSPIQKRQIG